jgi:tripartite-type tricarboxylate transporter receptor subunit TctC
MLAAIAACALGVAAFAAQAAWPDHPIRFVVPFAPGGANDLIARAAADAMSKRLGQPVIIENKPGAGALVGSEYVAKSKPDGYTFLVSAAGVVTNSMIRKNMPYKDEDLVPVGMIAIAPSVIVVNPSVPASNMKEFVAWARQQPNGVTWATAGTASTPHFVAEMLKEVGVNVTIVPFKSGGESVTNVIAGNVQATSEASIVVIPQIRGGKLKAIATTYDKITAAPEIPTTKEQGFPNVRIGHWAGLFAPRGTPDAIIERMNRELLAAVKSKDFHDKMVPQGIEPAPFTLAEYRDFMKHERERLGEIAQRSHMTVE